MVGYIFTHDGAQYDPNGRVDVPGPAAHNHQLEQEELAWVATKPACFGAYINDKAGIATTWLGSFLGTIETSSVFRNNLTGSRMRHVVIRCINGARYHGTYGCDWSQRVTLRRMKDR